MNLAAVRATARLAAFLLITGGLLPFYLAAMPFGKRARRIFCRPFYRSCVFLTGLNIRFTGARPNGAATLYVANHSSYLDIPVLASLADGLFVAKAEVRGWPLFGFLARIARTLFVSRQASRISQERLAIASKLAQGESVFLFPEGSSSDGTGVLPFRPGLLSAAHADADLVVPVQPVSIVYGPAEGGRAALEQDQRDCFAWYGDMELAPHLWRVFGRRKRITVSVHFHATRRSSEFSSPRALCSWAEHTVAMGIEKQLTGQDPTGETGPLSGPKIYAIR